MAYFWKYTRSGMYSKTYISFIIDVLPSSLQKCGNRIIWETNQTELEIFLVLLQDVEVLNNPGLGITKSEYSKFVSLLGYYATNQYKIMGEKHSIGTAVMGTHAGNPLPYGFIDHDDEMIKVDVTNLKYSAFPSGSDGKIPYHSDDKLSIYRSHSKFELSGMYWDYMPKHSCIIDIIPAMRNHDLSRTENYIKNILKWTKG